MYQNGKDFEEKEKIERKDIFIEAGRNHTKGKSGIKQDKKVVRELKSVILEYIKQCNGIDISKTYRS